MQDKMEPLKLVANDEQKSILGKVGDMMKQVTGYQKKVRSTLLYPEFCKAHAYAYNKKKGEGVSIEKGGLRKSLFW